MIKVLYKKTMVDKNHFSQNIEQYIKRAIAESDGIYFYRIDPLSVNQQYDKLAWIRNIEHEEYDRIEITSQNGMNQVYESKEKGDRVIKLDLKKSEVKRKFNENFKVGISWARGDSACKIGENDELFNDDPGYEYYNFVLTKGDNIIMDAILHGGFDIGVSYDLVRIVDEEYSKESDIEIGE